MSNYQFLPSPDVAGSETPYVWWDNGFSQDEITRIVSFGNSLVNSDAVVGNNEQNDSMRRSKVAWIQSDPNGFWIYDRLAFIARQLNGQYFQFDLHGFSEDLQYTIYESSNEGHYGWHMDRGYQQGAAPRKLSLVLQLSHPDEYEGGELQIMGNRGIESLDKTQGKVYAFPSFTLHRVMPVTKGTRRTLVVWLCGPKFR